MKTIHILLALVPLVLMLACNSAPNRPDGGPNGNTYQVTGVVVSDFNRGVASATVLLDRDSMPLRSADISFGGFTLAHANPLDTTDIAYVYAADPADLFIGTDVPLVISDSSRALDTTLLTVPDTFSILTIEPPNRIVTGLQSVSLTWSGSDSAQAYVLAAVRRSLVYTGNGYSKYVTSLNTAGTLPPDAFSLSPGPNPDTGWYYIYVYALTGAPDSALSSDLLPVPLPSQLADNIDAEPWFGRFGAVAVARHDSLHVVTQP